MIFTCTLLLFVALPCATSKHGSCIFCNNNVTYDFSSLSTNTFIAHSGVKGSTNHLDAWNTFFVTSPCTSVKTDACIAGPTADPAAIKPGGPPICQGLGSLAGVGNKQPKITPAGPVGVNITLYDQHACSLVYRMLCDKAVSADNPPEPTIIYEHKKGCRYIVTWKHPSACGGEPTPAGACKQPAPPPPPTPPCEACLPPWTPTWNMSRSTVLYTCNASGMHSVRQP